MIQALSLDSKINFPNSKIGVVIGSSRGCQSQWEQFLQTPSLNSNQQSVLNSFSSPQNQTYSWLETLPYQPATICANFLGALGIVSSPANACATGLVAIAQGYELIQQQRCSQVVVGAVETPVTPLTIAGFTKMKALAKQKCDPFGKLRDGFVLAEGGAMLLLESEDSAIARQAKIYGEILGWGMTCDAQAMTAPSNQINSAVKAIEQCLKVAHLQPNQIDYIHAHGTGTILNDQQEAKIISHLFSHSPYISSSKSNTGHTLGASGAIASALSLLSLQQQIVLPHLNYSPTNFNLNLASQASCVDSIENLLCFSFGFGGQNVIIAITQWQARA